jgi:hypothetical protein
MRTNLDRYSYVDIMGIIVREMMLCCKLPVERVPFGKPWEVGRQYSPPPPEQPNDHPQDGEGGRPGPGAVGRRPLLIQLLRQPGAVGGGLGQLRHEAGHLLFQQLKRKFFFLH